MPKFSIVTPVHLWSSDRVNRFLECAQSIRNQGFKDFEWIVVNDGSTIPFLWDQLFDVATTIIHKPHEERVIAYNKALAAAKGEWICLLDSDDEYKPNFLGVIDKLINKYPDKKMFNFGALYAQKDGSFTFRDPFKPKKKRTGHEEFGPGNIVNGTFVFHRSVYEDLGGYPGDEEGLVKQVDCTDLNYGGVRDLFMGSPWDFSAACQIEYPAIRQHFFIDTVHEPNKVIRELGNPWGNDYYLFYKYTRKYHSHSAKTHLYIVHTR
jgi:glycosyltransferase involved in cell wall biosynthesis